jgi:lysozyme
MKLSEQGISLLVEREALRLKAYKDTKGIWTIGIGHTGPDVHEGLVIGELHAYELFAKDRQWAERAVNDNVTRALSQNQFDALVSFVFNIGASAWKKSTMLRMINAGDMVGAGEQFDRWRFPPEVLSRRMGEKLQFKGIEFVARKT